MEKYNSQDFSYNNNNNTDSISSCMSSDTLVDLVDLTYNNRMSFNYDNESSYLDFDDDEISMSDEKTEQFTKQKLKGLIFKKNGIKPSKSSNHQSSNNNDNNDSGDRSKTIYLPVQKPPLRTTSTSFFHIFQFATLFDYFLMTFGLFFSILSGLVIPFMTNFFGSIFNVFTDKETGIITKQVFDQQINSLLLKFTQLGIGAFVVTALMITCWMWTAERQSKRMRTTYFKSLLRMNISYFESDEVTSGGLLTSVNKDTEDIHNVISEHLGYFIQFIVTIISCFILAFMKNAILTLVILSTMPLILIVIAFTTRRANPLIVKERDIFIKAGNVLENALAAIKTIRSFNGEEKEDKKHYECLQEANNVSSSLAWIFALRTGLVQFLTLSLFVQGFWFGSILVADKKLAPGDVLSVFYASLLGLGVLKGLLPKLVAILKAKNAIHSINKLLETIAKMDLESLKGFKLANIEGNIKFNQVSFSYPSRPDTLVLKNINLTIPAGKTTVLVGQSGSGKSTITQLIQKLYEPNNGLIMLDGHELRILNVSWLRQQIGIVSQEPILFSDTIFKNIAYGKVDYWNTTMDEVIKACKLACIHDTIIDLPNGYETQLSEMGKNLSGGQRQRIAIARALIKDPAILILDEATSALDMTSDLKVQEALENCRQNRTTIVITHQLKHVGDTDFVYVLHEGEIVESGIKSNLLNNNGYYSKLANEHSPNPNRKTHELSNINMKLKRQFTFLFNEPQKSKYGSVNRSKSIGKSGWRQSIIEEYYNDDNNNDNSNDNMDIIQGATATTIPRRYVDKSAINDILSYYEDDYINILITNESSSTNNNNMSIFKLIRETMDKKVYYGIGLFSAMIDGGINPVFSFVLANLLNTYSISDRDELLKNSRTFALFVLLIAAVSGITGHLKYFLLERASERWAVRLRHMGFGNVLRQPQSWFDKSENAIGKVTTILTSDTESAKILVGHFAGNMIIGFVSLFGGTIWALIVGWQLTLVGFGLVPVLLLFSELETYLLQKYELKQKVAMEAAANEFYQGISSVRTVFSLSIEKVMENKFQEALRKPFLIGVRKAFISGASTGFLEGLSYFTKALTFWYGAQLVSQGIYDLQRMLTVWTLVIFCTASASQVLSTIPYYSKSKQAIKSIQKIINLPIIPDNVGVCPEELKGTILFNNVKFSYPERPDIKILDGFNLKLEPGQSVALVGKSGNGKSTVAALLQRIYEPNSGSIMLDYENIKNIQLRWLRENVGIVSQEPVLFDMTIAENIAYGKDDATQEEIEMAAKQVNMHKFIISLPNGYNTKLGSTGSQLSGGERQRIAIARVLLRNPKILILDEATSALDTKNESIVQETLNKVQQGRTTLMITHRLKNVKKMSKIALVENGKIIESGTHKELMTLGGEYFELVRNGDSF
ncbi:P-loop containing nucleoside triphosphate hydrolase protein [Glomus cerebriforme]|uniref:P-loop containing nucleoside triphosphate hydrolase protein n=1 Tax=Glomus cerebriforme TaxID=658196 RepID=A0A397T5C0_9GLOM|nr:P-loop containing nucleoside triphosphate hydrolase protein [Glomus cerebriforme]